MQFISLKKKPNKPNKDDDNNSIKSTQTGSLSKGSCDKYGQSHPLRKCSAYNHQCHDRKKYNHWRSQCRSKKQVNVVKEDSDGSWESLLSIQVARKNKKVMTTMTASVENRHSCRLTQDHPVIFSITKILLTSINQILETT